MTHYVKEYWDVHGVQDNTLHDNNTRQYIRCYTRARVYCCSNIRECVRVICDGQGNCNWKPNDISEEDEQNESAPQNDQPSHTTSKIPATIEGTPASHMPTPTLIPETPESQLPTSTTINEIPQKIAPPITNSSTTTTPNNVPHSTMDLTINNFPTFTPSEIDINNQWNQIKVILPMTLWINYLQSRLTTLYKPPLKDHAKQLPIAKINSTIQRSPKNNATVPYTSAESYTSTASHGATIYSRSGIVCTILSWLVYCVYVPIFFNVVCHLVVLCKSSWLKWIIVRFESYVIIIWYR